MVAMTYRFFYVNVLGFTEEEYEVIKQTYLLPDKVGDPDPDDSDTPIIVDDPK